MSRLWAEAGPPSFVSWTERIVCDACGSVLLDRASAKPDPLGMATFSVTAFNADGERGGEGEDLLVDFCQPCAAVMADVVRERLSRAPVQRTVKLESCEDCAGSGFLPIVSFSDEATSLRPCSACNGKGYLPHDFSKEPL
jgi:hypothetical protein